MSKNREDSEAKTALLISISIGVLLGFEIESFIWRIVGFVGTFLFCGLLLVVGEVSEELKGIRNELKKLGNKNNPD